MCVKLYKLYNEVKDVFVKPKLRFTIKQWLITTPTIYLTKDLYSFRKFKSKAYKPHNIYIKIDNKLIYTDHKFPTNNYVWRSDIRKKLKKNHLSWIRPVYKLPYWLNFNIFNFDLDWKLKYGMYRYESSPKFIIVLFGIAFIWWTDSPKNTKGKVDDYNYWESILHYLNTNDIIKTDKIMGKSFVVGIKDSNYYNLDINYLKEPYKSQLIEWRIKHI